MVVEPLLDEPGQSQPLEDQLGAVEGVDADRTCLPLSVSRQDHGAVVAEPQVLRRVVDSWGR